MADAVKAITHWRPKRELVRAEHTREVVKEELPEAAKQALYRVADELEASKQRIARLERLVGALGLQALKDQV